MKHDMNEQVILTFTQRAMPVTESGCWLWTGGIDGDGYGVFSIVNYKPVSAHRFAYELHRGPIPEGLTIDHLCRVRCCVNPDHLEAVTRRVNTMRGFGALAMNARKTMCSLQHPFSTENTYRCINTYGYISRCCRKCNLMYANRLRLRKKALL